MKIVKFGNGKFGIRKGVIFFSYLDKWNYNIWWKKNHYVDRFCQFESAKAADYAMTEARASKNEIRHYRKRICS